MDDLSLYDQSSLFYNQEDMMRYKPGGFHPVCLGDTFKEGRYEIHHKLGFGGNATVWLAWDEESEIWVSIKVKSANSSLVTRELEALRELQGMPVAAKDHIVRLLDEFKHDGPNGCHQCLVFELLGPSVELIANRCSQTQVKSKSQCILRITTQLLEAISFIHESGYTHGDISGPNLAFSCSSLARLSQERLFEYLGTPKFDLLTRVDGQPLGEGVPKQLVWTTDWNNWHDWLNKKCEEGIKIIDFGGAFAQGFEPATLSQPADLRAPETIFTNHFDYKVDLWSAGLTIYMFVFGTRPFDPKDDYFDDLARQMINFVEELPAEWQPQWDLMKGIVDEMGDHTNNSLTTMSTMPRLDQMFHNHVQDPALLRLLPVIRGLTRFRPLDRISAAEALDMIRS